MRGGICGTSDSITRVEAARRSPDSRSASAARRTGCGSRTTPRRRPGARRARSRCSMCSTGSSSRASASCSKARSSAARRPRPAGSGSISHALQRALAVVGAVVDIDHLQLVLQQRDRGQDAVAVQAVRVQAVGMEVGRGDDAHAVGEQRVEQPVQDHRVGDVGDVELVEADQPEAARDAPAQFVERVDGALEVLQFAMHLAHELVEVQPGLARQRHAWKKQSIRKLLPRPTPPYM